MRALSQLEQLRSDPPDSLLGLERRARGDVETAVKLLHSQGYYDGTATFRMDSTTKPVTVRLHLTPGPRYVLGRASVRYEPAPVVPAALKHGKRRAPYSGLGPCGATRPAKRPRPPRFPDTLRGVTPGEAVTADQMLEAVEKLPERLRRRGYPLAQVSSQRYFLDRAARTLNAEIVVDTGPPALLGGIVVEGNKDVSATHPRARPWKAGTEPWDESRVQDYVDELRGLGLFSMVRQRTIRDVPPPRKDGMVVLPVRLVVREGRRARSAPLPAMRPIPASVWKGVGTSQFLRQRGKSWWSPCPSRPKSRACALHSEKTGLPGPRPEAGGRSLPAAGVHRCLRPARPARGRRYRAPPEPVLVGGGGGLFRQRHPQR